MCSFDHFARRLPPVDLIHCDVQGSEYDVLTAAQETLNARVRRVVVGTHSRRIEAELLDFFAAQGWRLEDEGICRLIQHGGRGNWDLCGMATRSGQIRS